jgi:hypothetical protein
MNDPTLLTQAEITAVSGGLDQSISISAFQTSTSTVTQTATATNSGAVFATATTNLSAAVASGPASSNLSAMLRADLLLASNSILAPISIVVGI